MAAVVLPAAAIYALALLNLFIGAACQSKPNCNPPCQSGGSAVFNDRGCSCQCQPALEDEDLYVGLQCEFVAKRCPPPPGNMITLTYCANNGTCSSTGTCDCPLPYYGPHCEFLGSSCGEGPSQPCPPHFECWTSSDQLHKIGSSTVCVCSAGWQGAKCDVPVNGASSLANAGGDASSFSNPGSEQRASGNSEGGSEPTLEGYVFGVLVAMIVIGVVGGMVALALAAVAYRRRAQIKRRLQLQLPNFTDSYL